MDEIWKDIEGYEGWYQISNKGRVRSVDRTIVTSNNQIQKHKGQLLQNWVNYKGYYCISLHKGTSHRKHYLIHRLVAQAFIENDDPINKKYINHKDENKLNNALSNLEWCTFSYNVNYGTAKYRAAAKRKAQYNSIFTPEYKHRMSQLKKGIQNKHCWKPVVNLNTNEIFPSITQAAKKYNTSSAAIIKSIKQDKTAGGGCKWSYYKAQKEEL